MIVEIDDYIVAILRHERSSNFCIHILIQGDGLALDIGTDGLGRTVRSRELHGQGVDLLCGPVVGDAICIRRSVDSLLNREHVVDGVLAEGPIFLLLNRSCRIGHNCAIDGPGILDLVVFASVEVERHEDGAVSNIGGRQSAAGDQIDHTGSQFGVFRVSCENDALRVRRSSSISIAVVDGYGDRSEDGERNCQNGDCRQELLGGACPPLPGEVHFRFHFYSSGLAPRIRTTHPILSGACPHDANRSIRFRIIASHNQRSKSVFVKHMIPQPRTS